MTDEYNVKARIYEGELYLRRDDIVRLVLAGLTTGEQSATKTALINELVALFMTEPKYD
jgi:hypothetical protein